MKKSPPRTLVRLWGETWQRWNAPSEPGASATLQAATDSRKATSVVFTLSARSVVSVPLWISSVDQTVIRESVGLELELRGLTSAKQEHNYGIVGTFEGEGKTLVVAAVYPQSLPEEARAWQVGWYEASPLLVELVAEAVSIWNEGGDLVAVVSREGRPVFWTTVDFPETSAQLWSWIEGIVLQLHAQGVLRTPHSSIVVSGDVRSRLALDGVAISNFIPSLDHASFHWKPTEIRERESREASSSRLRLALIAALTVVFLALTAGGLHLWLLQGKVRALTAEIRQMENETATFQPIIQEWQEIGLSVETVKFPLETLLGVVRNLPEQGIRLISYDLDANVVSLEGEAGSARIASEFSSALSGDSGLAAREWIMPAPSLLPDNSARFRIEGRSP